MNGFWLLIPFLLIRFGLLALLDREAVRRAAHFALVSGREIPAYWVYQISNAAIFLLLCFCAVKIKPLWLFCAGGAVYLLGLLACGASAVGFAAPSGGEPQWGVSHLRPLDHPGGGTMVLGTVRGGLPAVHGAGTALCLAGRISCGLSVSLFNFRNQDVIHHG